MSSRKTLVWLKPQYLGDAVMALPLIDALSRNRAVTVRAGPVVLSMLEDRAAYIERSPSKRFAGVASLLSEARVLRKGGFDEAFVLDRSFRSALAIRLSGIPVRVGHATEARGFLLTHRRPYDLQQYEVASFAELLEARDGRIEPPPGEPRLSVSQEEREAGLGRLDGATLGVQPGARYAGKQFSVERLAKALAPAVGGRRLALFGGPEEVADCEAFAQAIDAPCVILAGRCALRDSMGAAANLHGMVGNDTGWMHVAAALGVPTVTLFGPNPVSKWAHRVPNASAIAAPGGRMENLGEAEVTSAVSQMLAAQGGPNPETA